MSTFIASNAMKWGKKRDKTLRATCVCLQMVSKCDICSICRRKHLHIYISYAFCPKLYSTTVSEICLAECNIVCNMNFQLRFVTLSHKIVFQCVESFLAYQTCNVALRSSRTLNGKTWKKNCAGNPPYGWERFEKAWRVSMWSVMSILLVLTEDHVLQPSP